jgi:multidrug efflux pump subunit AcrA (membrane-fusion protein)
MQYRVIMFKKPVYGARYLRLRAVLVSTSFVLTACLAPVRTLPTPTPWPTPTVAVQTTFTVERATLVDEIRFNSEVVPLVWEPLSFRTEGTLGPIHKLEGDAVQEGDLLAELEMPDLQEALAQTQVSLEQAQDAQITQDRQHQFALERAQLELRKAELLLEQQRDRGDETAIQFQAIEVQLAQLAVQEVEANVDPTLARAVTKAQLAVEALQRQIEERQLRAPFAGQVIAIGIGLQDIRSLPQRPQPHTPIPAYTPLLVVAQMEPLILIAAKDTPRASELQIGQMVTLTHYLARDTPFVGEVTALPSLSSNPSPKPGFQDALQITLPDEHPALKIGDYVEVTARLAIHADTLVLPNAAVRRFAGRTFVIMQDGERQQRLDIQTGLEADGQVEVLAGLAEGDVVIGQ